MEPGKADYYHRVKSESSDQKQNSNSNAQLMLDSFPLYLRFVFYSAASYRNLLRTIKQYEYDSVNE